MSVPPLLLRLLSYETFIADRVSDYHYAMVATAPSRASDQLEFASRDNVPFDVNDEHSGFSGFSDYERGHASIPIDLRSHINCRDVGNLPGPG